MDAKKFVWKNIVTRFRVLRTFISDNGLQFDSKSFKRYLLVGTDYFTKWVEAEPLANIKDVDAKKFVWKNIVTRFGVSHSLISDNGL